MDSSTSGWRHYRLLADYAATSPVLGRFQPHLAGRDTERIETKSYTVQMAGSATCGILKKPPLNGPIRRNLAILFRQERETDEYQASS
jgi:hypothetical protein